MTPSQLAAELTISVKRLRQWLREEHPRPLHQKHQAWRLTPEQVAQARARWGRAGQGGAAQREQVPPPTRSSSRAGSDEAYVIGLCDRVLGEVGLRQHRFEWLQGDTGVPLPVDAYYPEAGLVVEYRELQHGQPVPHFDKPDRLTVSGVHRGEQRRLYDERREQEIPRHRLRLVVIRPADLRSDARGRLHRDEPADLDALQRLLD